MHGRDDPPAAGAFLFRRASGASWAEAFAAVPERIPVPPLPQGEAIGWDDKGLLVTSEGAHAPLFRIPAAPP